MKILLIGQNGQVGWELERSLMPVGQVISVDRSKLDISDHDSLRNMVRSIKPDVIVNAAAYTAVDAAEGDEQLAMSCNAEAPGILAEEAKSINALFIHYSTDYVFDGKKDTAYTEEDIPNPLNVYGKSKLAGEKAVQDIDANYLIFRTSWVFSNRGNNFLKSILRLARERDKLSIVADQFGTPTWARLIAESTTCCLVQAINKKKDDAFFSGIYNLTANGYTNWCEFAKEIVKNTAEKQNFIDIENIQAIPSSEYRTKATRPLNSRLDVVKLETDYALQMPSWQQTLKYCLCDY